jgi:type III secretion protein T
VILEGLIGDSLAASSGGMFNRFLAGAVAFSRFFGLLSAFPMFTFIGLVGILRFALAIGISLPLILQATDAATGIQSTSMAFLVGLMVKELAIGVVLGLVFGLPVWIAQTGGDIVDVYRGGTASNFFDPINAIPTTVLGQINSILVMAWIAVSGTLQVIFQAMYDTFKVWPIGELGPLNLDGSAYVMGSLMKTIGTAAFSIVSPFLVTLVVAELTLVLINKTSKKIAVNDLSSSVKNLVAVLIFPIYALFMFSYFDANFVETFKRIKELLGADF